jgi:hypothetical protein
LLWTPRACAPGYILVAAPRLERSRPIEGIGRAVFLTNSGDAVLTFEASADPLIVPITVHATLSEVFERGGPASV